MGSNLLVPRLSYTITIWFSQRTGSTLLCEALESTGAAGKPGEWLLAQNLLDHYHLNSYAELQKHLWNLGSTANRVFGLKLSFCEPDFSRVLEVLKNFPNCPRQFNSCLAIWENAFPNGHHIFMTRRNKVRLAVSWWKAIKTQEWYRKQGADAQDVDLTDVYSFDAINHLYCESVMREAGIQELFSESNIIPLTIVYEDFVQEYEATIKRILSYLGIESNFPYIAPPYYTQLADKISEEWVEKFREERQRDWNNRGW